MTKEKKIVTYPADSTETRLALLEMSISNINETMKEIKSELKEIRSEMKSDFRWLITIFGGLILGLAGLMAHGFHWF